jgi:hypothetical protein
MRRLALSLIAAGLMLVLMAAPALAINDSQVPADECSGNPKAVGEPGGAPGTNPGINQSDRVGPPVSDNNPGESTGARGQANSNANC